MITGASNESSFSKLPYNGLQRNLEEMTKAKRGLVFEGFGCGVAQICEARQRLKEIVPLILRREAE